MKRSLRHRAACIILTALLALSLLTGCTGAEKASGERSQASGTGSTVAVNKENSGEPDEYSDSQDSSSSAAVSEKPNKSGEISDTSEGVTEEGTYSDKEHVALYLHLYGHLPDNYITKKEAESLGWVSSEGNLWDVAPGKSIGGSRFGNYDGNLPEKKGRKYYECDIDFDGTYRSAERIIYSSDGLIYYTGDHYKTFERLY
ncbi:MAG: ribonuclease [Lachnospiraceae bacterium]|jgi:ribonuclease T1|nr:ribonuclease [Lachnospiraceae bacterium]